MLFTEVLHTIWVERNLVARQGHKVHFPLEHIFRNAFLQVDVLRDLTSSPRKLEVLARSLEILYGILDQWHAHNDNQWGL